MNIKSIATAAAAAGLLACATPSFATPVTLTFEGTHSFGFVSDFYNGGTDIPAGSFETPASGPSYNVAFGPDALALSNDGFGPGPDGEYYSNAPTPGTIMAPVGSSASLTATNGNSFIGSVSFFYSAVQAFTVDVLDAGNSVLATLNLAANNGSCGASPYCFWSEASLDFSGAAKSIRFGGGYDALNSTTIAGFDNITVNAVPVPAAGWLLASGLAIFGGRMRRKRIA